MEQRFRYRNGLNQPQSSGHENALTTPAEPRPTSPHIPRQYYQIHPEYEINPPQHDYYDSIMCYAQVSNAPNGPANFAPEYHPLQRQFPRFQNQGQYLSHNHHHYHEIHYPEIPHSPNQYHQQQSPPMHIMLASSNLEARGPTSVHFYPPNQYNYSDQYMQIPTFDSKQIFAETRSHDSYPCYIMLEGHLHDSQDHHSAQSRTPHPFHVTPKGEDIQHETQLPHSQTKYSSRSRSPYPSRSIPRGKNRAITHNRDQEAGRLHGRSLSSTIKPDDVSTTTKSANIGESSPIEQERAPSETPVKPSDEKAATSSENTNSILQTSDISKEEPGQKRVLASPNLDLTLSRPVTASDNQEKETAVVSRNPCLRLTRQEWQEKLKRPPSPMSQEVRDTWKQNVIYALDSYVFPFSGPPFKCPICGQESNRKFGFVTHIRSHMPGPEKKPYICKLCTDTFARLCLLERHMEHDHGQFLWPWVCSFCQGRFAEEDLLQTHKKSIHMREMVALEMKNHPGQSVAVKRKFLAES